jgi:hypothetical protein
MGKLRGKMIEDLGLRCYAPKRSQFDACEPWCLLPATLVMPIRHTATGPWW